ncbi:hypothetical protein QJS04_geneDACA021557 [Acorus gramineus]|uniref:DC1 domain-containing protein n=1 Tax=Acorus gramineus TaxID=55184 RepID=A0AAV9B236_ACOGR|nr:hypothetical protein QJS04_geneDACA021557 [Acorus gramineus]
MICPAPAPPRPPPRPVNNRAYEGIRDSGHQHPLQHDRNHTFATCDKCKEIWIGKMFRCPLRNCNFSVHEYCASPFLQPIATVRFYEDCVFKPFCRSITQPHPICNACGLNIRGYMYKCIRSHQCQRVLHPSCTFLRTLEIQGNKFYVERGSTSQCSHCDRLELWRGDRTWWFVSSVNSRHRIHVSCAKKMLIDYIEKMRESSNNNVRGPRASECAVTRVAQVGKRRKGVEVLKAGGRFLMLFLSMLLGDPTFTPLRIYNALVK